MEEENCPSREKELGPETLREGPCAENCPCPWEEMLVEVWVLPYWLPGPWREMEGPCPESWG